MAATITVVCPSCNNQMRASAEHIGKRGRCPSCKALVEIAPSAEESSRMDYRPIRRPETSGRRSSDTTDVKGWMAGLIAVAATVALYLAVFLPTRGTFLGQLFMDRGFIPYVITLFTCWGAALLVLKYLAVRKQRGFAELELELIPLEIGVQVTGENVDQFLNHLNGLPDDQRQSILSRRIEGALEHFKHRNSVPEVQEYLSSQAELDASGVDSGYTLLRAFIWAIPILGFIGTVMGISDAVSGLKQAMPSSQEQADGDAGAGGKNADQNNPAAGGEAESVGKRMMTAMGQVTGGLSTAFDTTLLALMMAVLLLFPTESLRKSEYRMLDRIEEFTNESLLRRMSEKDRGDGEAPAIVRDALDAAFQEHQRWLAQWQAQVSELGQVIGSDFEATVMSLQEKLAETERERLSSVQNTAQLVSEMFDKFGESASHWQSSTEDVRRNMEASLEASAKLQEAILENNRLLTEIAEKQGASAAPASVTLPEELREEFRELTAEIRHLAEKEPAASSQTQPMQTELPQTEPIDAVVSDDPPERTGLFGLFRGRNSRKE